ncbi:HEAT repeat domain-containing protein [Hymenobacter sp. BT559]|uniref:HEAT repeat domain-containing protein n=1 Tax=Hymenobacter sp. BT559 TaxID=2795729 RepID=UPI0018EBD503|nr:HEAT repeat domain-containing protein [Hymenobacter sp. BT559]MBJ6142560.1 HEAT repeat domain-containing protein [Hymenobacter sp. BT559]
MSSVIHPAHPNSACAELRPWLPELADGQPLPPEAAHLAAHLPSCPACQAELAELRLLFADLDALPAEVPPLELRDNFLAMLEAEKAKLATASPSSLSAQRGGRELMSNEQLVLNNAQQPSTKHQAPSTSQNWLRIAASVALVAIGAVLGLLLRGGQPATTVASAIEQPQQPTLSTRLAAARQQPASASQRLQLVSQAPALVSEPNDPAVLTLIHTLDTDPNPNVRLAACEALVRLRNDPRVGPALIEALPLQTDPNVQITLIEALVTLREKRAVPELQQLAQQPEVLPAVRQQAESGLGQLI